MALASERACQYTLNATELQKAMFITDDKDVESYNQMVFVLLWCLLGIIVWKMISAADKVAEALHALGKWTFVLQWYSLLMAMYTFLFLWNLYSIYQDAFIGSNWLDKGLIANNLIQHNTSWFCMLDVDEGTSRAAALDIPSWLRVMTLCSPSAGVIAFSIMAIHYVYTRTHWHNTNPDKLYPDRTNRRQDMLITIILMPGVFLLMSLRSTDRMVKIMTGSVWHTEYAQNIALYKENFEFAAICQYWTVFMFVLLCHSLMRKSIPDSQLRYAFKLTAFQGVYAWCVIGTVHSILLFLFAYASSHEVILFFDFFNVLPKTDATMADISKAEYQVGLLASFASILCTLNMVTITKLPLLNERLPNATLKFNGTKILLLLGPNQLKILQAIGDNTSEMKPAWLDFSKERAMLVHSSLLCYECLIVVIINFLSWHNYHVPDNDEIDGTTTSESDSDSDKCDNA